MTEFRVAWHERYKKTEKVLFVEASDSLTARRFATNYIERKHGIANVVIDDVKVAEALPPGRVALERVRLEANRERYGKPITEEEVYGKPV